MRYKWEAGQGNWMNGILVRFAGDQAYLVDKYNITWEVPINLLKKY